MREWRDHPAFDFAPPYSGFNGPLQLLAADPVAARFVEGIALRIRRGDEPSSITAWAVRFAARRGLLLPASFPS